ncbi:Cytochrome c oxidase subunit 6B [Dissophora globulifera]|uniref:Cytochrome c oxidase subunit n=1 Tax=Dissophora globulifera TaxID=979702 RepID=A0A9P6RJ56_9FUNG|nr:Cytochrome c oxidase subunit 6B [Dissophora globulifera]KAG0321511.1 Cytochrome c oxidase subunit 6B [Dissophora globulifera]
MSDNAEIKIETAPFDARFPNTNQSKHCWQAYSDYYKCIDARGEEFTPCKEFRKVFKSICPNEWVSKWDEQREEGTLPFKVKV